MYAAAIISIGTTMSPTGLLYCPTGGLVGREAYARVCIGPL